jgi:hypothetical protein
MLNLCNVRYDWSILYVLCTHSRASIFPFKKCPSIWIGQTPLDNFKIHRKISASALGNVAEEVKKAYPQFQKK